MAATLTSRSKSHHLPSLSPMRCLPVSCPPGASYSSCAGSQHAVAAVTFAASRVYLCQQMPPLGVSLMETPPSLNALTHLVGAACWDEDRLGLILLKVLGLDLGVQLELFQVALIQHEALQGTSSQQRHGMAGWPAGIADTPAAAGPLQSHWLAGMQPCAQPHLAHVALQVKVHL